VCVWGQAEADPALSNSVARGPLRRIVSGSGAEVVVELLEREGGVRLVRQHQAGRRTLGDCAGSEAILDGPDRVVSGLRSVPLLVFSVMDTIARINSCSPCSWVSSGGGRNAASGSPFSYPRPRVGGRKRRRGRRARTVLLRWQVARTFVASR
jgi:hypothetical protein